MVVCGRDGAKAVFYRLWICCADGAMARGGDRTVGCLKPGASNTCPRGTMRNGSAGEVANEADGTASEKRIVGMSSIVDAAERIVPAAGARTST